MDSKTISDVTVESGSSKHEVEMDAISKKELLNRKMIRNV